MMSVTLDRVLERLRSRAETNEDVAEALEFLAADSVADPFRHPGEPVLAVARAINRRRQQERRDEFRSRALSTPDVVALIGSMSNRKAVDRRRRRGTLLGVRVGNQTLHPDWQFDRRRGDTREGLERVLAALRQVTSDVLAADALMTVPRQDLDGASVADVFADGDVELAARIVAMAGDQS
jgi:hypothetical protein